MGGIRGGSEGWRRQKIRDGRRSRKIEREKWINEEAWAGEEREELRIRIG